MPENTATAAPVLPYRLLIVHTDEAGVMRCASRNALPGDLEALLDLAVALDDATHGPGREVLVLHGPMRQLRVRLDQVGLECLLREAAEADGRAVAVD